MEKKKPDIRGLISDGLLIVGAVLISAACWQYSPRTGMCVAGVFCMVFGALVARGGTEE